jgi:hypothetical protein
VQVKNQTPGICSFEKKSMKKFSVFSFNVYLFEGLPETKPVVFIQFPGKENQLFLQQKNKRA